MATVRCLLRGATIASAGLTIALGTYASPAAAWPFKFPPKAPAASASPRPSRAPRASSAADSAQLPAATAMPALVPATASPAIVQSSASPASSQYSPAPSLESSASPSSLRSAAPPSAKPQAVTPFVPVSSLAADPRIARARTAPILELRHAAWMSGTWEAHGKIAGAAGQAAAVESSYVIDMTMKRRWMFGAEGNSRDFFFLGYDPFAAHWVMLQLDGSPGYALLVAPQSWQNGHISFFGDAYTNGRRYRRRTTIARRSAREFTFSDDEVAPDGSFVRLDRYEFTKQQ